MLSSQRIFSIIKDFSFIKNDDVMEMMKNLSMLCGFFVKGKEKGGGNDGSRFEIKCLCEGQPAKKKGRSLTEAEKDKEMDGDGGEGEGEEEDEYGGFAAKPGDEKLEGKGKGKDFPFSLS